MLFAREMSRKLINSRTIDTIKGRTQPYGFWRAGNPWVKLCVILVAPVGITLESPSIVLQGAVLILLMLKLPVNPKSSINNILWTGGAGSFICFLLNPRVIIPYEDFSKIKIHYVTDLSMTICILIFSISLFLVRRAFTTRDYDWFIAYLPPGQLKIKVANLVYSFGYGMRRLRKYFWEAGASIRNRGMHRFFHFKSLINPKKIELHLALWCMYFIRCFIGVEKSINFVVASRMINKTATIAKYWSTTDKSLLGVIFLTIIVPRLFF